MYIFYERLSPAELETANTLLQSIQLYKSILLNQLSALPKSLANSRHGLNRNVERPESLEAKGETPV